MEDGGTVTILSRDKARLKGTLRWNAGRCVSAILSSNDV